VQVENVSARRAIKWVEDIDLAVGCQVPIDQAELAVADLVVVEVVGEQHGPGGAGVASLVHVGAEVSDRLTAGVAARLACTAAREISRRATRRRSRRAAADPGSAVDARDALRAAGVAAGRGAGRTATARRRIRAGLAFLAAPLPAGRRARRASNGRL